MPIAFAIPYHRKIPMDKYLRLSFLLLFVGLVITRYPEILVIVSRILVPSALQLLFPLRIIHLIGVRSSPVVHMLFKILGNTTRSFEYPLQTIALQLIVCLHYGCFPYV